MTLKPTTTNALCHTQLFCTKSQISLQENENYIIKKRQRKLFKNYIKNVKKINTKIFKYTKQESHVLLRG